MKKSPLLAFFLAFIPGFGHMYLGHRVRGFLYSLFFFGALALAFISVIVFYRELTILFVLLAALIWGINGIDMVITLLTRNPNKQTSVSAAGIDADCTATTGDDSDEQNERFFTILLSLIPGVGHFHLGLNQRGLTLLAGFFGIFTMIFFIAIVTNQGGFLIFLLALPIIWIYSLFDSIQLLNKKQAGETLEDKTIMDDLERFREDGKKSKMLATLLAIFPGAGHMYLGLQRRGLQLMIAFLLSIYILDILHLSIFLFLIPIIWFYSFFDALQQVSRVEAGEIEDVPIVNYLVNYQKWIGIGLLVLGIFYLFDSVLLPVVADDILAALNIDLWYYYRRYFQVSIVCLLLIGGGIKLIRGSKQKKTGDK
ncbi:hypothetical protein [Aquibacillus sediminis]|uniref:hypothetical protein n=1 Tax=Aquibacillus sediminis TaxID=2574734 RepID=UPI001109F770|nr:hypothetical protein [Aquibacillus sediminis]